VAPIEGCEKPDARFAAVALFEMEPVVGRQPNGVVLYDRLIIPIPLTKVPPATAAFRDLEVPALTADLTTPLRNRWFVDSPVEGDGFEPLVPVRQAKLTWSCR